MPEMVYRSKYNCVGPILALCAHAAGLEQLVIKNGKLMKVPIETDSGIYMIIKGIGLICCKDESILNTLLRTNGPSAEEWKELVSLDAMFLSLIDPDDFDEELLKSVASSTINIKMFTPLIDICWEKEALAKVIGGHSSLFIQASIPTSPMARVNYIKYAAVEVSSARIRVWFLAQSEYRVELLDAFLTTRPRAKFTWYDIKVLLPEFAGGYSTTYYKTVKRMFWSVYTPEHEEMLRMIQSDEERAALIERLISDKFLIRRLLPEKFQNVTTIEVPERITGEQFCKMLHTLVPRISNE